MDPSIAIAYITRGRIYQLRGETENALADYNKAIELDPSIADTYIIRGSAYKDLGKTEKAKLDFAKAKELGYEY